MSEIKKIDGIPERAMMRLRNKVSRLAEQQKDLRARHVFFMEHAGYATPPGRAKCALDMAKAEVRAIELDCQWRWSFDEDGFDSLGDHAYWCEKEAKGEKHEHQVLQCVMYDKDGKHLASLCGIIDPDKAYKRVIQAELAVDADLPEKDALTMDDLFEVIAACKAAVEDQTLAPSARLELVRDFTTPIIVRAESEGI